MTMKKTMKTTKTMTKFKLQFPLGLAVVLLNFNSKFDSGTIRKTKTRSTTV